MKAVFTAYLLIALAGCLSKPSGSIRVGDSVVRNAENAAAPAQLKTDETKTETQVEAGTKITSSIFYQGRELPAVFELPAFTVSSVSQRVDAVASNSRAPDKSVELRRADNEARMPLLYAAIGAGVLAIGCVVLRWPGLAAICGAASAIFFFAWQAASLPAWFWMLGVGLLFGGACLFLGYKRGEWDANGNLIPDALEGKK